MFDNGYKVELKRNIREKEVNVDTHLKTRNMNMTNLVVFPLKGSMLNQSINISMDISIYECWEANRMKLKVAKKQNQAPLTEGQNIEKISAIAYELYERNGYKQGQAMSDWLIAEQMVRTGGKQ